MVMNRSFRAFAMSTGSVYVLFSYMIVVGDVRCCDLDGRMDLRIFACSSGLFLLSSNCCFRCCFFAVLMSLLSLFLCFAWFAMFSGVGFVMRFWNSVCCFLICFFSCGLHHGFLGRLGLISYFSTTCCIACWICSSCCVVEGWGGDNDDGDGGDDGDDDDNGNVAGVSMVDVDDEMLLLIVFWIAVLISGMISSFSRSYRPRESVLCLSVFGCLGGCLWIIAYVGR